MPLPVEQFPILSFAQNNPGLAGAQMMGNIHQQNLRNQLLQQQAAVNPQMLQAQLAMQQAKAPELQAQTEALKKKTGLANLMAAIQAQGALTRAGALGQSQSRFGPAFQLAKSLQGMSKPARDAWTSQNQGAYNNMLNDIGNAVNNHKASTGQYNFLTTDMIHQMLSGAGANFPQAQQQPQQQGEQQVGAMQAMGQPQVAPQMGQQPQQQGNLAQQLAAAQQGQGQQQPAQPQATAGSGFSSSPEQIALVQRANEMASNQALTTTATRKRAESGAALDKLLSTPELNNAFKTMSQYAGAGGKAKAIEESFLEPVKYAAYQSASQQIPSILSGAISQLEGFPTSDAGIKQGLNFFKMAQKSLSSDPHAAMEMFRKGVETLRARNKTIQEAASPLFNVNRMNQGGNIPRRTSPATKQSDPLGIR